MNSRMNNAEEEISDLEDKIMKVSGGFSTFIETRMRFNKFKYLDVDSHNCHLHYWNQTNYFNYVFRLKSVKCFKFFSCGMYGS